MRFEGNGISFDGEEILMMDAIQQDIGRIYEATGVMASAVILHPEDCPNYTTVNSLPVIRSVHATKGRPLVAWGSKR